jgi:hypothetical protein
LLSYDEILQICDMSFRRTMDYSKSVDIIKLLSEYVTTMIFKLTNKNKNEELSKDEIIKVRLYLI